MSEMKKFRNGDYLLLLLYADEQSKIIGRTRLQKISFLFEKEILKRYEFDKKFGLTESLEFKAYHYGPFSKKVFQFADLFTNFGLIEAIFEINNEKNFDNEIFLDDIIQECDREDWEAVTYELDRDYVPSYILTKKGKHYVENKLWNHLNDSQKDALCNLKRGFTNTPLKLLIKLIYTKYPNFAAESKIKEDILKETKWQF